MPLLDNLPHTCTISSRTRTKGTLGGSKDSLTTVQSGVACWRQPASQAEVTEFQKRGVKVTNKVYFVTDPNIDERNVITIDGDNYEVRSFAVPDASVGLGVLYKVMVERTTTGST